MEAIKIMAKFSGVNLSQERIDRDLLQEEDSRGIDPPAS